MKKGLNLRLIILFTVLTLVLTTAVIAAWEQFIAANLLCAGRPELSGSDLRG